MPAALQRFTLKEFRETYGDDVKPRYEFWDGEAIQKAVPTKLHAKLQKLLANVFAELGFYSFTELTLRVSPAWEPVPDVAATLEDFDQPYPAKATDVIAEVLSPQDSFSIVEEKCERYAIAGASDVLVFDPIDRKVWKWGHTLNSLIRVTEPALRLNSNQSAMDLQKLWLRFDSER